MFKRKKRKEQSRAGLFLENMFVYGLGGAVSKFIPFIMLPIITRMLPSTYYYGISDLVDVIVSFGASFSVMGMYDIMFRIFFDKEDYEYRQKVCTSTITFVLLNTCLLSGVLILLREPIAYFILGDKKYTSLVIIAAISIFFSGISLIVSAPTRMQNQKERFLVANTVIPIISYAFAIGLLKLGAYEYALPIVTLCNYLLLTIVFIVLNHSYFKFETCDWHLIGSMLKLAIPLVPNFIVYWIFNSSDRLMINNMISTDASGVYAVGAKLGHLSQLIYSAFAGGWQYFAFSTMKDDDQIQLTSRVFEYLGAVTFAASIGVTVFSRLIFTVLFSEEYSDGYIVMPYLFVAPLLLMLFQTAANQFLIIKKTWPSMLILFCGAFVNIIINFFLIPVVGIEGAALGTLFGYIVSVFVCVVVLKKMRMIEISKRFLKSCLAAVFFFCIWRLFAGRAEAVYWILGIMLLFYILYLYKSELRLILSKLKRK